jgi:hypothetical protein
MKTEIPSFDSELKDQLVPNVPQLVLVIINIVAIYGPLKVKRDHILSNYAIV